MSAAPTPSPWRVAEDGDGLWIYGRPELLPFEFDIAQVMVHGDESRDEALANARLLAAAPELLAVIRGVIQNAGNAIDTEWLERAIAAIAKVERPRP